MSTTSVQPRPKLDRRDVVRTLLRGVCAVALFYSAGGAAHGVLASGQFWDDEIPAGKITAIIGNTKLGPRLQLDNGSVAVFSLQVLLEREKPVELAVGDTVEKRRDSFVYLVNDRPLTDIHWVLWNWLLPMHMMIPLGVYVVGGTIYVLHYRRTPLGEFVWSQADPERPCRPRTRAGMVLAMLLTWLVATGMWLTAFGCFTGCLSGVVKSFRNG